MTAVLAIATLVKTYGALRPLRIERLTVKANEHLALMGLDQPAAEIFINLVTGASLPDQGEVVVAGTNTRAIADSTDWLNTLDRFGIVSERSALLEPLSVIQNLALPFTLEIEPPPDDVRSRAASLMREVGLDPSAGDHQVSGLRAADRLRVRLARALALDPALLLVEHPSATLPRAEVKSTASAVQEIVRRRGIAALTLTMDDAYAPHAADRVLTIDPATGSLSERRSGRLRFWS